MKIIIDEKDADIVLEDEKTVGEALSGIENWLSGAGLCISGIALDGENVAASMDDVFKRPVDRIDRMAIKTSLISTLHIEALYQALECLAAFASASSGAGNVSPSAEKERIQEAWEQSAGAHFLSEHDYSIFNGIGEVFKGKGSGDVQKAIADQVACLDRMIKDPAKEFLSLEAQVVDVNERLETLPLDMQTGKDKQAAETIDAFSTLAEKMFGLIRLVPQTSCGDAVLDEFNAALKEFLAAYENKDMVLIGDLAEYELAPRLSSIYNDIKKELARSAAKN
jgi:hypothetical protein